MGEWAATAGPAPVAAPEPAGKARPEAAADKPSWLATGVEMPRPQWSSGPSAEIPLMPRAPVPAFMMARPQARRSGLGTQLFNARFIVIPLLILTVAGAAFYQYAGGANSPFITPVLAASTARLAYTAGDTNRYAVHQDMHGKLTLPDRSGGDSWSAIDAIEAMRCRRSTPTAPPP